MADRGGDGEGVAFNSAGILRVGGGGNVAGNERPVNWKNEMVRP